MGADSFFVEARGETAKDAFQAAVEQARHECGNGGYTGTIAEKGSFTMIPFSGADISPYKFAEILIDDCDPRVDDKWGPCGCIEVSPEPDGDHDSQVPGSGSRKFLFFGWASS